MGKKVVVGENCNACGLCFENSIFKECSDGTCKVNGTGVILSGEEAEIQRIAEQCPANNITLMDAVQKDKTVVMKELSEKADGFKIPVPDISEFSFKDEYIVINRPFSAPGEYRYIYSSYNAAMSAAKEAIKKAMYEQRLSILRNIVNSYRVDRLSKYYAYEENEENFYYQANQKAQEVLNAMLSEIELYDASIQIPDYLKHIDQRPRKSELNIDGIKDSFLYTANAMFNYMQEDYYSLSSYAEDCDTDEMDEETTGAFGRTKTVTKYCYKDTDKALDTMEKDLRDTIASTKQEAVVERAHGWIKILVETYSSNLKRELKDKAEGLIRLIQ